MDYKVKRSGSYLVEVTFTFTAKEVEEAYQAAYKQAQKKVKIDGFRKGRVPLDLIEKMFGENVAHEVVDYLLSEHILPEFDRMDPKPIAPPEIDVEKLKRKKSAVIKAKYEAFPVYKMPKYKKLKVTKLQLKVPERLIEEELKRLQKEEGLVYTREEGDGVQEGDVVRADVQVFRGQEEFQSKKDFEFEVSLEEDADDNTDEGKRFVLYLSKAVLGLKADETGEFDYSLLEEPLEFDEANEEGVEKNQGESLKVSFVLKEATYIKLPEINDEFAQGLGDYKNLVELREKIKNDFLEKGEKELQGLIEEQLIEQLVSKLEVEVPSSMIELAFEKRVEDLAEKLGIQFPVKKTLSKKRKSKRNASTPLSPKEKFVHLADSLPMDREKIEKDMLAASEHSLRQQLVIRGIYTKEGFGATEEELIENMREHYTKQYGELSEEVWKFIFQDEGARESALHRIRVEKVVAFLEKHAVIKKGPEVDVDKITASSNT